MGRKIWRDLVLLLLIFGALWWGASVLSVFEDADLSTVGVDKEVMIGESIVSSLKDDPSTIVIYNAQVNDFVDSLYSYLLPNIEERIFDYNFIIVDDESVNAFAVPGGNIFVHSGLIAFCETPEELAAVISHEIGHSEQRHVISRLIKKVGLSALLGGDLAVFGEIGQIALETVYDRSQETAADQYAMTLLENSNISPLAISRFFRRLEQKGKTFDKRLQPFMTHPHNDERVKAALNYHLADDFEEKNMPLDLAYIQEALEE